MKTLLALSLIANLTLFTLYQKELNLNNYLYELYFKDIDAGESRFEFKKKLSLSNIYAGQSEEQFVKINQPKFKKVIGKFTFYGLGEAPLFSGTSIICLNKSVVSSQVSGCLGIYEAFNIMTFSDQTLWEKLEESENIYD